MAEHRAESSLRWLDADENRYGIRILDCRELTQGSHGWLSLTSDTKIAERFGALRGSDGRQHRGQFHPRASTYKCDLWYPPNEVMQEGMKFRAREMEDKWDLSLYGQRMYCTRSWTGELVLVAELDSAQAVHVMWVAAPPLGGVMHPSFAVREFDFLMKSHIYRQRVPNPVPAGYSEDASEAAKFSMHRYGRWASFASFEDTTVFNPWC